MTIYDVLLWLALAGIALRFITPLSILELFALLALVALISIVTMKRKGWLVKVGRRSKYGFAGRSEDEADLESRRKRAEKYLQKHVVTWARIHEKAVVDVLKDYATAKDLPYQIYRSESREYGKSAEIHWWLGRPDSAEIAWVFKRETFYFSVGSKEEDSRHGDVGIRIRESVADRERLKSSLNRVVDNAGTSRLLDGEFASDFKLLKSAELIWKPNRAKA